VDHQWRIARAVLVALLALVAANYAYGLVHELAHAVVVEASGGHVFRIYVNPAGPGAYTEHTPVSGTAGVVALNLAGLGATTLLAVAALPAGRGLVSIFLAGRTAIYALNYGAGTDMSAIYAAVGPASLALSLLVAGLNAACIIAALGGPKRVSAALSSSLWRARRANSSAE
jgi:hypothetical protein